MPTLRLDVFCLVRLRKAYGIKASRLIREMEEKPYEDESFLGIQFDFGDKSGTTVASNTASVMWSLEFQISMEKMEPREHRIRPVGESENTHWGDTGDTR